MVGYRYANRYQAADVIGQDEISVVRRGRDLLMDRDVAIKVLRSDLTQEPAVHSRFRSVAHHAAALNHPAFVAVYDTGDTLTDAGTVPWVVMEYVEGDSLRTVLDRQGPLPWRRALRIAVELCAALDHAHRRNLLPCHITPANVLVDPQPGGDQVKVIDIGQRTPETPGSVAMQYLSPERIRGGLPDKRSDQYTIGCVLFEMLCGRAPFIGTTADRIADAHQREAPRAPSEYDRDIPADVDAIVLKALSKNPANRYETAEKMRADLERVSAGRAAQARQQFGAPESAGAPVPSPARVRSVAKPRTGHPAKPEPGRSAPLMAPGLTLPVLDEVEPIDPVREAAQRRRWAYIGLGGLAVALVVALWLTLVVITTPPPPAKVAVPNVIGMSVSKASSVLKGKNLNLGAVTTVDTDKGPTGSIVNQRPSEKTEVDAGTEVAVEIEG